MPQLVRTATRALATVGTGGLEPGPVGSPTWEGDWLLERGIKATRGPQGWGLDQGAPLILEGLDSSSLGTASDFCLHVSPMSSVLSPALPPFSVCRAVSQDAPLKVTPSRSVPALSFCLVGRGWGWADFSLFLCRLSWVRAMYLGLSPLPLSC